MNTIIYQLMIMFYWFSVFTYLPTLTPYLTSIGVSYSFIGLISSAYGIAQMLLRIPLGIASDRLRRRRIFINLGILIGLISSIGLFLTENQTTIFIMRALSGVAASTWVIMTVLFSSYFTSEKAASRMSQLSMINASGQVVAMLLGSALTTRFGYKAPFLLSIFVAAIAFVLSLFIKENVPPITKAPPTIKETMRVGKDRNLMVMSVLAAILQIILSGATSTFLPEIARNLGASNETLGLLSSISTLPRIASAMTCAMLLSKQVNERTLIAGGFLVTVITIAMTPFSSNLPILFAVTMVGGFGKGMVTTVTLALCTKSVDVSLKSTGMGFYQAIYGIGMSIGPAITGVVSDMFGIAAGFLFASGVAFVGFLITLIFLDKKKVKT